MTDDRFAELFRCEQFISLFPEGMPRRAYLRRQDERRVGTWDPVYPFCANECDLGRETRRLLGRGASRTCDGCGSGLIAAEECRVCAETRAVSEKPVRTPERAPPQLRIWTPEVPDVPIGDRPRRDIGLGADVVDQVARRVAEVVQRGAPVRRRNAPTADESPQPAPDVVRAHPTEEPSMACPECKSATRHKLSCSRSPEKAASPKRPEKAPPKPPPPPRQPSGRAASRPRVVRAAWAPRDLAGLDVEQLLELRDQVDAEIHRRLSSAEAELERLKSAITRAAQAAREASAA